ncbi:basic secretory protein-like protein [Actinoallomurus sp. CA-142502]|uniref:basic secretory protein-like protein n=1 Tax=Actinoallomurus sp. CA-142502 TaxID=3239885 RepID=UPI003D8A9094
MPAKGNADSRVTTASAMFAGLAGLAIVANLAVAVGYLAFHDGAGRAAAASSRPVAGALSAPSVATVNALLQRRSRAVLARDRAAFLATVDPSGQAFRAGQQVLFDNLAKVPLSAWRESLADTRPAVAADDGWTARLRLTYRLRGFDRRDLVYTEYLTFDRRPGTGWMVSGDGAAHGLRDDPQIWNSGGLTVVHGRRSLVLAEDGAVAGELPAARTAELRDIAARLDEGVGAVSGVVGDRWARHAVALVPATEQKAEELAGDVRNLGDIAALAAVTGDEGGQGTGEDRLVITPTAFGRLTALGRRVVLTHELVHVAMGGARDGKTPMWLIEGLADYVGYKKAGVPTRAAGRELADLIATGGVPATLPGATEFAGSGDRLSAAYEEAWLACRMVAERYGEDRLVRLYRTAEAEPEDSGDPRLQDRALRSVLGVGTDRFVALWRAYVRRELA